MEILIRACTEKHNRQTDRRDNSFSRYTNEKQILIQELILNYASIFEVLQCYTYKKNPKKNKKNNSQITHACYLKVTVVSLKIG